MSNITVGALVREQTVVRAPLERREFLLLAAGIFSNLDHDKYRGLIVHQGAELLVHFATNTTTTTRSQRGSTAP